MAYQTPITIAEGLRRMHKHDWVLPAIQREFVWSRGQIIRLFDSLMRKYPIGSFLFWKIDEARSRDFVYYDFIREYHELKNRHCAGLPMAEGRALTAILDGQQRLSSLNVALAGSHAEKLPRKWKTSADAYPVKHLYLDLTHDPDPDDGDLQYRFEFLSEAEVTRRADGDSTWFRVSRTLEMEAGPAMQDALHEMGLGAHRKAFASLWRLHEAVSGDPVINFYEETDQDIDRVLDIFIRVNSYGTELSQSDLLLSIATSQWEERDAREVVHALVDDLNAVGRGFAFSKDLVLKAGLVMIDASDVRFNVKNFNRQNMLTLEDRWDHVERALKVAAQLLARFGLNERTLGSASVLIPLADWIYRFDPDGSLVYGASQGGERERVRSWVLRALFKRGVWGSGLDTLLQALRAVIREHGGDGFPVEELEKVMARRGKPLTFDSEEIQDLVETTYGSKRVFPLLSFMYHGVDVKGDVHIDHVFPKSLMTSANLRKAGIPDEEHDAYRQTANQLPNLQLVEGSENEQKQATLPAEWFERKYPDLDARSAHLAYHDLTGVPDSLKEFKAFYEARRQAMTRRLGELLGVTRE